MIYRFSSEMNWHAWYLSLHEHAKMEIHLSMDSSYKSKIFSIIHVLHFIRIVWWCHVVSISMCTGYKIMNNLCACLWVTAKKLLLYINTVCEFKAPTNSTRESNKNFNNYYYYYVIQLTTLITVILSV